MSILAVDQSYTSCGIIVMDDDRILFAERFVTDKEQTIYERAAAVTTHLRAVAKRHKVAYIALEGLAFAMNGNATRDLAGLQFTIIYALQEMDQYEVIVIAPNTVKKVATGKGNAKKEQLYEALPPKTQALIREEMGLKKTTGMYDITDAYWIGIAAQEKYATKN